LATYEQVLEKYGKESEKLADFRICKYRRYLGLAEKHLKRREGSAPYRLLDIGAHCGFFMRYAQEKGWQVYGVEPAGPPARFGREVQGVDNILEGFFSKESFAGMSFDLISMLDVLEHLANPLEVLRTARSRLAEGGLVLCKVPHVQFYLTWQRAVSVMGRWGILPRYPTFSNEPSLEDRSLPLAGFFDLVEHVVHYDERGVAAVFGNAGFENWKLLPAAPTNHPGHFLNLPRTLSYWVARMLHAVRRRPGLWTHGLVILAW
jgi:SAM-dependent methyltransferase